jgi:hypothetical protein
MANTENLRPWKPGQSGNPGGRPKRDAITAALREQLESQTEDTTGSVADAIAAVLVKRALGGDVRAIREIADRTEGRPRQQIKVEAEVMESEDRLDLSKLSDDQLRQVQEILDCARMLS